MITPVATDVHVNAPDSPPHRGPPDGARSRATARPQPRPTGTVIADNTIAIPTSADTPPAAINSQLI
jgi:hypothetical protein